MERALATARPGAGRAGALELWLVVNALNLVDAVLSSIAIDRGWAVEANPVVRTIGFEAKVVVVAAASAIVARLRPGALWVPIAALAAVVLYEAAALI